MKFYFRSKELEELEVLRQQSEVSSRMAVLTGRRRVGKTSLALEFVKGKTYLYLFVDKKSEVLLCQNYTQAIQQKLGIRIHGRVDTFIELFN